MTGQSALAQSEVDADFSKYCRDAFSNSAYQRRAQPWGVEHYCVQGGTLQGIDLAQACMTTTGSRQYRKFGDRILCHVSGSGLAQSSEILTREELVEYCRTAFPNSTYEQRNEATGPQHYCRRVGASGGFSLQNVDLADACQASKGGTGFERNGALVFCTGISTQSAQHTARASDGSQQDTADRSSTDQSSNDSTSNDKTSTSKSSSSSQAAATSLAGQWEMTVRSIRPGMKVRLSVHGDKVVGTIVEIPANLAQAVRNMDGLKVGQPFLYGQLRGGKLTGTTRIGLAAASQVMNRAGSKRCKAFVADIERNPRKWMPFELTRGSNALKGRHKFVGLTLKGGKCTTFSVPDTPPRLKDGHAIFEMARLASK